MNRSNLLALALFIAILSIELADVRAGASPEAANGKQSAACPGLQARVDKSASPLIIITEAPIPGPKSLRAPSTPGQTKCAESLREAGKSAIEKKKVAEGVSRYLEAVKVAPAQAEATYQELANALDRKAYVQPALAAYFKVWKVIDAEYYRPDAKLDGVAVLVLADVRDSIVRLGGQVPIPSSEVGRIVIANTTRQLREQYFNADPLLLPNKPEAPPPQK